MDLIEIGVSVLDRGECRVVGRGGSRTALTGAVIMEQAGSTVGAGSARPSPPVVILLSQRAGKPRPYEACHLGSYFSIYESVYSVTGGVGIHPFPKHFNKSFSE